MRLTTVQYRLATLNDLPILTRLNQQLIEDEDHRNRFASYAALEKRMRGFLTGNYEAILFEEAGETVAYALFTDHKEHPDTIYLKQFFVCREVRRRGIGREAMRLLKDEIWPKEKRLTVDVLWSNEAGRAFWQAVDYRPYALELEILSAERTRDD